MNLIDWLAHPTRFHLKISVTGRRRTPTAFELFGRRWHVGITVQAAGAPVIDGCSTTNFDHDYSYGHGASRSYGGVCIRLRPTLGHALVIARRDRPVLILRRPWLLCAPRPSGRLIPARPRAYTPYESLDDFTAWEQEHPDTIND